MNTAQSRYEIRYRLRDSGSAYTVEPAALGAGGVSFYVPERDVEYEIGVCAVDSAGNRSPWTTQYLVVPSTDNLPLAQRVQELDIDVDAITIDASFGNHRLTLSADVSSVTFVNVPAAATLTVEIEQWGGSHTIDWPANVSPISGVPHAMTSAAGSVDIVTLQTTNGGVTWYQTVFAAGTGFAVVVAPSPATGTSTTDGVTGSAPSVAVTCSVANETAPVTYAWSRDDAGGTDFAISSTTSDAPTFSIPSGTGSFNATQRWRVVATDAAGKVAQAIVNVTLARSITGAGSLSLSLSPNPAGDYQTYPDVPSVSVTPTVSGGTAPYTGVWSRVDAGGGTPFSRADNTFYSSGVYYYREQTWRYTVTDDTGASIFEDVIITLERSA